MASGRATVKVDSVFGRVEDHLNTKRFIAARPNSLLNMNPNGTSGAIIPTLVSRGNSPQPVHNRSPPESNITGGVWSLEFLVDRIARCSVAYSNFKGSFQRLTSSELPLARKEGGSFPSYTLTCYGGSTGRRSSVARPLSQLATNGAPLDRQRTSRRRRSLRKFAVEVDLIQLPIVFMLPLSITRNTLSLDGQRLILFRWTSSIASRTL